MKGMKIKMRGETNFRTTDSTVTYKFQEKENRVSSASYGKPNNFYRGVVNNMWYGMVLKVFGMEGRGNCDYERR